MTGIETFAVILFTLCMIGAFLSFFPHWTPKEGVLKTVWDYGTNVWINIGAFIFGMILLYLFG